MIKKSLELDFLDGVNKKFKISLNDPKEDLESIDVIDAMDTIIEKNIFNSNNTDLLVKDAARIIETTVEIIEL